MSDLIDLENLKKNSSVLYSNKREVVDEITGEIKLTEKFTITKEKTRDNFVKLFVENIGYLMKLENSERNLFFIILTRLNYKNMFTFDKSFRKTIIDNKILSRASLYRAFKMLIDKKIIIKVEKNDTLFSDINDNKILDDNMYIANPNIVGKGSWHDLKNLRQTVTTYYDFENLEATKEMVQETKYIEFDEVVQEVEEYEVKDVEQDLDAIKNELKTEILIGKKDNIEAINLDIEIKRLELEIKRLELEKTKLDIQK